MYSLLNKTKKYVRGFTLVETLIAITILVTAVAGPMTLIHQGFQVARYSRSQLIASYLAEDAMEYIRYVRDNNRLGGNSWLTDLDPECTSTTCKIDTTVSGPQAIQMCNPGSSSPGNTCTLRFNATTGLYGYSNGSGWSPTNFKRYASISEIEPGKEALVTVVVEYLVGTTTRTITVENHLLNW